MPILFKPSQKDRAIDLLLIAFICLSTLLYLHGVADVPFHPDESTYLYMSADWDLFTQNPMTLGYQPNNSSIRQKYRLLDPPLGRYLIGISRSVAGFPAPITDWTWSLSWDENKQNGALPSQELLIAGRLGPAALFPFSLILIYLTGWRLGGRFLGWSSMLLLGLNALILLHTSRAMSESGLVFTICLFMSSLVFCRKRPWLIAVPAALMVCAKQSTLPLVIIGAFALFLYAKKPIQWRSIFVNGLTYALIFLAVFLLLNPVFWLDPSKALQSAVQTRQELVSRQTNEFGQALPEAILNTPWKAAISMTANLFFTPPAIADVGNYLAETNLSTQRYFSNPIHSLFRDLYLGGLMLVLTAFGFLISIKNALARKINHWQAWILLATAGTAQFLALIFTVALPFQRYVIPLVPFTCLWISFSLCLLKDEISRIRTNRAAVISG